MDPGGLWKGMLQSQGFQGAKAEIRGMVGRLRVHPFITFITNFFF